MHGKHPLPYFGFLSVLALRRAGVLDVGRIGDRQPSCLTAVSHLVTN